MAQDGSRQSRAIDCLREALRAPDSDVVLDELAERVATRLSAARAPLLNSKQVGTLLGISAAAVVKRAQRGTIRSRKIGRKYYFRQIDLEGEVPSLK